MDKITIEEQNIPVVKESDVVVVGGVLTGEACGTAAALAIKNGTTLQDLDIKQLQDTLEKNGVKLHRKPECEGNINLPKAPRPPEPKLAPGEPNISKLCVHKDPNDTKVAGGGH